MSTYQTTGFVLSNKDFREADKFFSIYTPTHGKIEGLACGVRKIKSKLRAHLEPFSVINLMIAPGRRYDRLIGAVQQKNYKKIKSYQLLEIVDQLTKLHHPDIRIFNLLKEVFDFLESQSLSNNITIESPYGGSPAGRQYNNRTMGQLSQINHQSSIYSYFIIRFLSYLGYTPELQICVRCKNPVSGPAYFSVRDGSVICGRCANADQPISQESREIFQKYLTQNLQECRDVGNSECDQLIQQFLNYHLDQPLKSQIIKEAQL